MEEEQDEAKRQELLRHQEQITKNQEQLTSSIPVPPKYKSSDFISTGGARYWHLRGKLDVPKERWVSFPHCEGEDGTLVIAWAGYDHLQLARSVSSACSCSSSASMRARSCSSLGSAISGRSA